MLKRVLAKVERHIVLKSKNEAVLFPNSVSVGINMWVPVPADAGRASRISWTWSWRWVRSACHGCWILTQVLQESSAQTLPRWAVSPAQGSEFPFKSIYFIFSVYECLACMYVCAPHACSAIRGQTSMWDPLQTIGSCLVGVGGWTRVLLKSKECS